MWCPGPGLHSGVWGIAPVLFPACQKRWLEGGCGRLWWRCLKVTYCYSPGLNLQQVWRKGAAGYCKHETVGSVLWTTSYSSSLGMDEEEEIIVTTGWRRSKEKCSFTEATNTFFRELSTGWTVWSVTMVLFMYLLFFFFMSKGQLLSMGYGFVQFLKKADAKEALKNLQNSQLDGHHLELKMSTRTKRSAFVEWKEVDIAVSWCCLSPCSWAV